VLRAASLVVVVAVLLSGCTASSGSVDDVIRATGSEPANPLIPADTVEIGGARIVDSIFAGLVTYQPDGTAVNDVADTIEASADKKVFTVTLRDGLEFTNGGPVDSDSFVNAWDWAADSANKALDQSAFSDILGYLPDDPATPDVERSSLIEKGGLVVVDARTFEIHLKAGQADFPQRLGTRAFFPLPDAFYDDPAAFGEHPIGNGPYRIDGEWRHGEGIDLVANPDYDGPRKPVNAGVSLVFYKDADTAYVDVLAGFLDVIDTLPASAIPNFKDELGPNALDVPGATLLSIVVPAKLKHLVGREGVLRRAALSLAIDRATIVNQTFGDHRIIARDFTAPVVAGYSDVLSGAEVLNYEDDLAKDYWAQADAIKKTGPWEGTLQIAYAADSSDAAGIEAVAGSIARIIGIDVETVPYPTQDDLDAAVADGSLKTPFVRSQTAHYPGMLSFLGSSYVTKAPRNVGGYSSKDFDAAMKAAALAGSPAEVLDSLKDAQRFLFTDLPAIPLWYSTREAGAGDKVADFSLGWDGVPAYWAITKTS
jgi:oligopeptide transport system substrate-binding protein